MKRDRPTRTTRSVYIGRVGTAARKRRRSRPTILLAIVGVAAFSVASVNAEERGVLDYRDHDFSAEGPVSLDGEWLIYWNRLISPDDPNDPLGGPIDRLAQSADGVFRIPHTWNTWQDEGKPVGGFGAATFVVDLHLPDDLETAALWIPNASTAYRLWSGTELLAQSGTPGLSRATSKPHYVMNTAEFDVPSESVRLTLQVSNFHHRRGGMWKSIKLGTPRQINVLDANETAYDLLLLGSFVALGLFNLLLFFTQRRQFPGDDDPGNRHPAGVVPLLLAFTFFALVARVFVTGQILITRLIPTFPWSLQLRIEYLSAMVIFALFAVIAGRSFPGVIPRLVIRGILVFVALNAFIALFFPVVVYSRVVTVYNGIKSAVLLGMTVRFNVWASRGHREAWAIVGAITIFFLITLGETLHYREIILSRDFAPVGFIVALVQPVGANETLVYLVTTLATLGVMLVVFNLFAVRISLAFMRIAPAEHNLDHLTLVERYGVSPRELEILDLVAEGLSNKEIGARLAISEGTVKNHLYRIMRKLGVGNRTEIAIRLVRPTAPDHHQ